MFQGIKYSLKSLLKKPFKVGIISTQYFEENKGNNGTGIHTYYLSKGLAKLGCEVHIFTKGEKNSTKVEYLNEGKIVIHKIDPKLNTPIKDPVIQKEISYFILDNKILNEVTKEHNQEKFDILHTHSTIKAVAFMSKYAHDLKWIHTFHVLNKNILKFKSKEEQKYLKVTKWLESTVNYADALITVSNHLKIEVLQNYPIKSEKVHYIPNGVDLELFTPENIPQEDKKILYIGRFSLEKGIDLIPKIITKLFTQNKRIKFEIVAPDQHIPKSLEKIRKEFERLVEQYPNRIIWHREPIGREKIAKLFQECTIYIQPSRYESFGLTALEAMACGKAVIVSNKGGLPETVGNAGKIIPLNSSLFLKEILRLLQDYKLRERYGRRATERAKSFEWEDIAEKTLKLYKKVVEEKPKENEPEKS